MVQVRLVKALKTVEVARLDNVLVDQPQIADSGLCKIVGDRTPNPTYADDCHLCGLKLVKARFPDLRDGRHSRKITVGLSFRHGSSMCSSAVRP